MEPLKQAIFSEIRKTYDKAATLSDADLNCLIFHHPDGRRLSKVGFILMQKSFSTYSFELPAEMKAKHQMAMSKMEYPYFLFKNKIILFSEMDAMVVKLHGGMWGFLESYIN
jgi:hypothetical protein